MPLRWLLPARSSQEFAAGDGVTFGLAVFAVVARGKQPII